jgi:hypothetical protein
MAPAPMMPIFMPPLCRSSPPFVHRSMRADAWEAVPAPDESRRFPVEAGAHGPANGVIVFLPIPLGKKET